MLWPGEGVCRGWEVGRNMEGQGAGRPHRKGRKSEPGLLSQSTRVKAGSAALVSPVAAGRTLAL